MPVKTYVSRQSGLMKDFDRAIARVKHLLVARYGEENANALMRESRQKYEELIPEIPYIGDKNPLLIFLLPTSRYLAIYRTFTKHGKTLVEVGQLVYEIGEAEFKAIPRWIRRVIGILWFSPWFIKRLQKRAKSSHGRKYPGGYVLDYIEGDGQTFDYGVDYIECASCKFLEAQDAYELRQYVCAVDKVASEMLGWGLRRTKTLADGDEKCDFRFKKGGNTFVRIPQSLK